MRTSKLTLLITVSVLGLGHSMVLAQSVGPLDHLANGGNYPSFQPASTGRYLGPLDQHRQAASGDAWSQPATTQQPYFDPATRPAVRTQSVEPASPVPVIRATAMNEPVADRPAFENDWSPAQANRQIEPLTVRQPVQPTSKYVLAPATNQQTYDYPEVQYQESAQINAAQGYLAFQGTQYPGYVGRQVHQREVHRLYSPLDGPYLNLQGGPTVPLQYQINGCECCDEWQDFCGCGGFKANPGHYGIPWLSSGEPCDKTSGYDWRHCQCNKCKSRYGTCQSCK